MLMVAAFAALALTVPLAGGKVAVLARARLARVPLLLGALALQVVVISVVPGAPDALLVGGHLLSYGLALGFLWANRTIVGLWIVIAGTALNVVAITANGGVMPADSAALERAGRATEAGVFENSAVLADPRVRFLGDVFAVPDGVPFANVFSVGDVLIVVGAAVALHELSGSRFAPWARRRASSAGPPR
jgi:hypothetical protein